jgi:hypothetical protein
MTSDATYLVHRISYRLRFRNLFLKFSPAKQLKLRSIYIATLCDLTSSFKIFCSHPLHVALPDLEYSILKSFSADFFAAIAAASLFLPLPFLSGTMTEAACAKNASCFRGFSSGMPSTYSIFL